MSLDLGDVFERAEALVGLPKIGQSDTDLARQQIEATALVALALVFLAERLER